MLKLKQTPQIVKADIVNGICELIILLEANSTGELDEVLGTIRLLTVIKDDLISVV